jgi:hypothetical protein
MRDHIRSISGGDREAASVVPPTSRPNTGSLSNRGRHSQSIDPVDEQSAAVRVSPISPNSEIGIPPTTRQRS